MLSRLLSLFRRQPATIHGSGKLPEGHSRKVDLGDPYAGGVQIVLCRIEGQLHALDTACPHENGRIHDGPLLAGRYVTCPLHGYHFDPVTGECQNAACADARRYRVEESGDDCRVWL